MSNEIVIADADVGRRQAAVERIIRTSRIHECGDRATLLQIVMDTMPAVVVIGSLGPDRPKIVETAHLVRNIHPAAKVIIVADFSSEAIAIGALRAGVSEYLIAPVTPMEIAQAVVRLAPLAEDLTDGFDGLIGASAPIRATKELIRKFAPLNSTVLITGESGVGKEIVARLVHQHSLRAKASFVCVNCAAIPDSLAESELFGHERGAFTGAVARQAGQMKLADHGTLFLDEIGDMSIAAQAKMLRALEQHEIQPLGSSKPVPIDIRLITATHCDLHRLVREGKFRSDLYYRLDVSRIHVPPLRERPEDIPVLAFHFMQMMNREHGRQLAGLTPGAMQTLMEHDWPGNVRQLRNVIESAAAVCASDRISDYDLRALHSFTASGPPVKMAAAAVISTKQVKPAKDTLLEALEANHWNMTKTAERLSWSRSTLYRNVARFKIERNQERAIEADPECADEESDSLAS